MAKLIYIPSLQNFLLTESDRDKELGFRNDILCMFSNVEGSIRQDYRLFDLFGIDDKNLSSCKRVEGKDYWDKESLIISESVNPYVIRINGRCVVYFGDDIPKVKSKAVKTKTRHYRLWTGNTKKDGNPATYYYVYVKEKGKLFFYTYCYYDFLKRRAVNGI